MKRIVSTIILFFFLTGQCLAALAVDATATHDQDANADPWEWTITTGAGANLLVVLCHLSSIATSFSGVTHNGDALTSGIIEPHASGATTTGFWYRVNPDIGAGLTISVDLSATNDGGCVARSYTGAGTPINFTSQQGNGTAPSMPVTCETGGQALSIVGTASIRTITEGAGQTAIMTLDDGSGSHVASTEDGAATNTMSYSWATNTDDTHVGGCVPVGVAVIPQDEPIIFE